MPEARAWGEECDLFYDGKGSAALRGIDGPAGRRTTWSWSLPSSPHMRVEKGEPKAVRRRRNYLRGCDSGVFRSVDGAVMAP
jgi:hypothetical protein